MNQSISIICNRMLNSILQKQNSAEKKQKDWAYIS